MDDNTSKLILDREVEVLLDPYMEGPRGEGVPIHLDLRHDLLALETGPWGYDARAPTPMGGATS